MSDVESTTDDGAAASPPPLIRDELSRPIDPVAFRKQVLIGAGILFLLIGGWGMMQRQRLRRQDSLAAKIEGQGGAILYDTAFDPRGKLIPPEERSSGLLAMLFGADPFRTVEAIELQPGFDRESLDLLVEFPELKQLSLRATTLTTEELESIVARTPKLERLDLREATLPKGAGAAIRRWEALKRTRIDSATSPQLPTNLPGELVTD